MAYGSARPIRRVAERRPAPCPCRSQGRGHAPTLAPPRTLPNATTSHAGDPPPKLEGLYRPRPWRTRGNMGGGVAWPRRLWAKRTACPMHNLHRPTREYAMRERAGCGIRGLPLAFVGCGVHKVVSLRGLSRSHAIVVGCRRRLAKCRPDSTKRWEDSTALTMYSSRLVHVILAQGGFDRFGRNSANLGPFSARPLNRAWAKAADLSWASSDRSRPNLSVGQLWPGFDRIPSETVGGAGQAPQSTDLGRLRRVDKAAAGSQGWAPRKNTRRHWPLRGVDTKPRPRAEACAHGLADSAAVML